MAKFLQRWFGSGSGSKNSSLRGSQSSLNDTQSRTKTSNSLRTSSSLENLGSYHIIPKELEKNKLHKASWEGNLNKVTRLARPGQINVKDQQQRTPLHLAIVKGHIDIVKYLVQEDAKLDVVDNEQRTPLIKAVLSGNQNPELNYQICKVLMDGGADKYMNAFDKYGRNALHYAISFGNQNLVKLFLSYDKCDPNLKDRDHMTPLHLAIKRNSPHIVQLLLSDQQADPNIGNHNGQTPLHIAASVGYVDIVRLLLISNLDEPCDPTILDSQQLTAYELAKNNHQVACAKLIQEYQQKWLDETPRKAASISINEQPSIKANSSISLIPAANLQHEHDETSDDSSSVSTSKPSKGSPRRIKRASDQWSDDNSQQKPAFHGINNLFKTNPLQPHETNSNAKKTAPKAQKPQSSSIFGIGPVIERLDSDNTSTSMSSVKPATQTKPVATNPYVNTAIKPVSNTKSWSDDTITSPVPKATKTNLVATNPYVNTVVKPVSNTKSWSDDTITSPVPKASKTKSDTWDTSPSEDDISILKPKPAPSILQKTQSFTPSNYLSESDSEKNSVETEIRRLDVKKPSTVENIISKNIGSGYKVIGISEAQSPLSEDSSWTTSVPVNKQPTSKGVGNLIQKPKTDESTWDDSRPLSADLKKSNNSSVLSNLIQRVDTTGVENLTKIMDTIINSNKKQSTSQKVIGKLLVSPMTERTNSESTSREMENEEDYEQSWKKKTEEWSVTSNGHDFKSIRQLPRSTLPYDINSIRGSTSSTKSSFNDQMQFNELKENIKRLERTQEDTRDLKRQLKDMENKKNDFEKLYKENDKMLRNIENKLEQEKTEKQRLEMTTKNLNTELKNIKQKLQSLEDEKDLLNQRCIKLKEERDNHDEKLHALQNSSLHSSMTSSFRDDDIDRMKSRHREEMKILSSENDDLHHRTKQLQNDLQLHKESLDVTIRYKFDLEKALEEKTFFQHELDHLKHEKELIEQEKLEYKTKYNSLQEEIRLILLDRSKLEQKLTGELQEHIQEKQRSTDDIRKHRTEIEQLNIKLDDAEARLLVLQTQNETLLLTKDRDIKTEFDSLTQRLNKIESDKSDAEQRYHKEITNKPLSIHTSTPLSNTIITQHQRSYIQPLNKTFPQSQQQQQNNENYLIENSRQIRSDTERVKSELDRLRQDFDKLVEHYEPISTLYQQTQLHSQIDTFRQFYEHEFRQRQLLMSKLTSGIKPIHHSHETSPCSACTSSRFLKERLETAIDKSLADERLQTIKQIPAIPRQASSLLITNNTPISSVDLLRKRYHV